MRPDYTSEVVQRFWSHVKIGKLDECWEWQACLTPRRYGQIRIGGHTRFAHRVAWTLMNGPIPDGLVVCHTCDNPPCCNPSHLFLGTRLDNTQDAVSKKRHSFGETHGMSKLTTKNVDSIRTLYATGKFSYTQLGALYSVDRTAIYKIVRLKRWRILPKESEETNEREGS